MKRLFIVCSLIFLISGVALIFVISKNYPMMKEKFSEGSVYVNSHRQVIVIERKFSAQNNNINIDINVGDVVVEAYDGKDITVKTLMNQENTSGKIDVEENNGTILVRGKGVEELTVLVPREKYIDAKIKIITGNLRAENIKNAIIEIDRGDFFGRSIENLNSLSINTGDAKIEDVKEISRIKINTGDLDLFISNQNKDFLIENKTGDINLNINDNYDGILETETKVGEVSKENLDLNVSKYKGIIKLETGDIRMKGVEFYDKKADEVKE